MASIASSDTDASTPITQSGEVSSLCARTESMSTREPSDSEVEADPFSPLTQESPSSPPPIPRKKKRMAMFHSTYGLARWELENTLFRVTENMPIPKYRVRILQEYFKENGIQPPPRKRRLAYSGDDEAGSPPATKKYSLLDDWEKYPPSTCTTSLTDGPDPLNNSPLRASPTTNANTWPTSAHKACAPATPNRKKRPKKFAVYNFDHDWCRDTREPVPTINMDYPPTLEDQIDYDTLIKARKEQFDTLYIFNC